MFRKLTLLSFLLVFLSTAGFSQERHVCGTSSEMLQQIQERLIANKEILRLNGRTAHQRSQEDVFIPLKFHLIAEDNGRNRANTSRVFDQMCTLNETFKDLNLQFYIKDGFNIVNDGRIFKNPTRLTVISEMEFIRDPNAVNIFVVKDAQNPDSDRPGNTLGYYTTQSSAGQVTDWIVIEREQLRNGGMTLPHELGHFFSLLHPFNGWEEANYNPAVHGSPAQETSPGGVTNEYADGSNCEAAGDMICDTPADYLTSIDANNCKYRIDIVDPKGDTLNPDPTLIMGYFLDKCMERFTPMQTELMITDYNTPRRDYLRGLDAGLARGVNIPDTPINLIAPGNGATVSITDEVRFEWQAVQGAQYYGIEVFSFSNPIAFVQTSETSVSIPLEVGAEYRWKVRPYNDTYFCAPDSELRSFNTDLASAVSDIQGVEAWTIQPNPLTKEHNLSLSLTAKEAFDAKLRITNLAGQVVQSVNNIAFNAGSNHQLIDTENLNPGVYIVALDNREGVVHQKLVIQ